MTNLLTTFLSRVLGAWIAGAATYLLVRFGIDVDQEAQQKLIEALVLWVIPTLLSVYSIAHRMISKKTNPGDAASSHLAEKEGVEADRLKANSP